MSALPAELSTGMVHGRFIVAMIDGDDADQEPDVIPASGRVVFKAGVPYVPVHVTSEGPVTVLKGPITGVIDSEGYLCTPHPVTSEPMYRGVKLLATDDPDMAVTDWTWAADYRFESVNGVTLQIPAHSFALPGGTVVDLTTMVKVPSSPGYGLPQAEAAAIRASADATTAAEAALRAEQIAQVTDTGVASLLADPLTETGSTLSNVLANGLSSKVSRGEFHISVKDYGAKGDGVTDDTAAWIAAESAAVAKGADYILSAPYGIYRTSGQITVRCALEAGQATIRYYGTGTALVVGDESALGKVTPRRKYNLPRVINMTRGTTGWDGSSVGVKLVNLDTCNLYVPFVQDFEQGLVLSGMGAGVAYCTITLGALWDNHKNLVLTNDATGWANQNTFIGGRLNQTLWKGAFLDDPNANQLSMISDTPFGGPNNNTFIGTSFEGVNISLNRLDISGKYNQFVNCRWENFGTPFRVRYREFAEWNEIHGGYNAGQITEVFDGIRGGGALITGLGLYSRATNSAAQSIPNSVYTDVNTWSTPTMAGVTYNATTGEFKPRPGRWMITATACFAPNATGRRVMRLHQDESILEVAEVTTSSNRSTLKCVAVERFNGSQTFKMSVYQTSGAALALEPSAGYVKITANYLGY